MAYFIEVNDIDKKCTVIINMDAVMEIAPINDPVGCEITFLESDDWDALRRLNQKGGAILGRRVMRVSDSYELFKQFVIQRVSAEDIAKVNGRNKNVVKEKAPVEFDDIPKL
jgi:hypothetical protein